MTICKNYDIDGLTYWYVCDGNDVVCDEDGNSLHFDSFEDAEEYVDSQEW